MVSIFSDVSREYFSDGRTFTLLRTSMTPCRVQCALHDVILVVKNVFCYSYHHPKVHVLLVSFLVGVVFLCMSREDER